MNSVSGSAFRNGSFSKSRYLASDVLSYSLGCTAFVFVFANLMTGPSNLQPKIVHDEEDTYDLYKIN